MKKYTKEEIRRVEAMYEKEYYESMCANNDGSIGMATGNVLKHQIIQSNILVNCRKYFDNVLSESRLSDEILITPDISVWRMIDFNKGVAEDPMLTIEITHTRRNDRYSNRTICMAFDCFPSIVESFIYNYVENVWYRYYRDIDGKIYVEDDQDYSQVLEIHLGTLLE